MRIRLLIALILAAPILAPALSSAEALPVFSDTGPDAAAYGAADGYPLGTGGHTRDQRVLVGSFSHFDEILPSRPVRRAAAPFALKRAAEEMTLTWRWEGNPDRSRRGELHTLTDYLERTPATGLLILKDDTILFEHYRYGRRDTDRLTSQSMAKTITAMLVGIAVEEGAIRSIDDPAAAYVPEIAESELGKTPIRALLHMASGIEFSETYDGTDDAAKLGRLLFAKHGLGTARSIATFNTRVAPPDTLWHYAGINSDLLGLVVARATQKSLADYAEAHIWRRIGTEADASWAIDSSGQEAAYCCFNAVLRDWGRLGRLLAYDGAWQGEQLIPRQWLLDATTAAPGSFLAPGRASRFYGYGYQVWLLPGPRRNFALLGIHGQTILVDPQSKLVLVHTAARVKPSGDPQIGDLIALWKALVERYGS
jgi:CubicO group peptidase (beta-lactamase class C family)